MSGQGGEAAPGRLIDAIDAAEVVSSGIDAGDEGNLDDAALDEAGLESGAEDDGGESKPKKRRRKASKASAEEEDAATREPRSFGFSVEAINSEWALVLMGSKAVIVREQPQAPIEDRLRILSIEAFKAWFMNRFTEYRDKHGDIAAATWASAWLVSRHRRQYSGIEFAPRGVVDAGESGTFGYLNLWRGHAVTPGGSGSYAVLKDHLLNNVCSGSEQLYRWVFGWFAHIFQRPRERVGTALVLRGAMGSGKSKIGEVFGGLIPQHYFMVDDPRYVTGQFNAHMASCLLLQADEAVWAGDKAAEGRLKGLITSRFQMIEQKGIDPIRLDNYLRLVMTSNEDWVVPAGKDERRFCVLDVQPHCAQNHEYFAEMDRELADGGRERLLADLLAFDLSTVNLRQIPLTEALLEQKLRSLDSVDAWWLQRLMEGAPVKGAAEWPGSVAKEALHDDYVAYADRIGVKRRSTESEMGMKLRRLIPDLSEYRPYDEAVSRRRRHYVLPPLIDAREAFSRALSQPMDWPDVDDGQAYGA